MKKQIIILFLLPLLSFGQANKFFRQGQRSTDPKEQIDLFSKAIDLDSKHLDAYFYRAIAKDNIGDYNGAILDYTKVIFYEPDADPYYNRGNSKYKLQDYFGAKEDYEKAVELDPEFIEARFSLAYAKYELEDYEGAIIDLDKVVKAYPRFGDAHRLSAFCNMALKKQLEAIRDFSLVIFINSTAEAYYNRGALYMDINYYKKANQDFSDALKIDSEYAGAHFFRGVSYYFLGKYDRAISNFNTAISADNLDFDAYLGLAFTYYKTGDLPNAKLNFQKVKNILSVNTSSEIDKTLFANTYWYLNQYYLFNKDFKGLMAL
jgi:tetratricopeptide (TPR) repeat protein